MYELEEKEIFVECPRCENKHEKHVINIERQFFSCYENPLYVPGKIRKIEVVLSCPAKNLDYKVLLELPETINKRGKSVKER